jgi:DNA mismatch repair protein MutS
MNSMPGKKGGLTPLMKQYYSFKAKYPDKILFFRMGDFYEMFDDDAVRAAPILNIALTSRGHMNGEKIPLAGVPYHSAEKYLARLLKAGEKVVIVEQVENPKLAKGVVKRDVVEIITPGTSTIDETLETTNHNYLLSLYLDGSPRAGIAYIDLSTGKFRIDDIRRDQIIERIRIIMPREIIYPEDESEPEIITALRKFDFGLTGFGHWNFDLKSAKSDLSEFFGVATLDGFGVGDYKRGLNAAGAIYRYLRENLCDRLDHITQIAVAESEDYMMLDYSTVRNLELVRNLAESTETNSLFKSINRTVTAGGSRRLRENIVRPYIKAKPILYRQQAVKELYHKRDMAMDLQPHLKKLPDLERLAGRLGMRKINPRQLASISDGLSEGNIIIEMLDSLGSNLFKDISRNWPDSTAIVKLISKALVDETPLTVNKGGIIREGYSHKLDELKQSISGAKNYIASLQKTERKRTGIPSLKVGFNKVFGYYIEVTKTHLNKVPKDYIRKQTLVNAERYVTGELKVKEDLITAAEEKIFSLEQSLYEKLVNKVAESLEDLLLTADFLSEIDLIVALANLAGEKMYSCPEINDSSVIDIAGGRHPVIESLLPAGNYIANDLKLDIEKERIMILTGPNMSGKSTYLRQIGLIVILAQIGSFVPAESASIGLVDRVFTRVGAIDKLAQGQSTFLVEMIETSNILHNATEKSLILLDEVGRGTSTFDGLSIAWSVAEHINEHLKAKTIFATHYHELTGLAALYNGIVNFQVAVKRWEKEVIFLHKIIPGGCDDSYGIEVARLAGIPNSLVSRSRELLKLLESGKFSQSELAKGLHREIVQRSLFDRPKSEIEEDLRKIDINDLTPLDAIRILNELKDKLDDN